MRWFDVDGNQIKDWQVGDEIPDNADAIQFDLKMGGVIWGGGFDIPLDIDVPFFSLDVDGGFAVELGWSFDFGFGLSVRDGVYLTTNEDGSNPELELTAEVFLDGAPDDRFVTTPFKGVGKLLFFKATLEDNDTDEFTPGHQPSGLSGGLSINYSGNESGRLTVSDIFSSKITDLFEINFGMDATLDLGLV